MNPMAGIARAVARPEHLETSIKISYVVNVTFPAAVVVVYYFWFQGDVGFR